MLQFLKYLMLLLISPAKGWEDIAAAGLNPRRTFNVGLLPMICICGLSCLISAFYTRDHLIWPRIIQMIVTMGAYFVTYFIAMFVYTGFTNGWIEDKRLDGRRCSLFVSYNLAILILFNIIRNLIPDENALINFLPVFDILIMWQGMKYLRVRESSLGLMMLVSIASVQLPVLVIEYLFKSIIS